MKAIRVHAFGGPEVLLFEECPEPGPGRGELLIRIKAAGVNPVDTYVRSGTYPLKPDLPYIPGMDAAGVVEMIGEDVSGFSAGDRVFVAARMSGCYAEKLSAASSLVHRLPDHLTFQQGAAIGVPYGAACRALFQRADARAGETVLIHGGSGGVGVAAIQLARAAGLHVIATAGSEAGLRLAEEQGAHAVIDHHRPDHFSPLLAATDGKGFDVIIEMLANENLGRDLPLLSKHGRVVVVGSRGPVRIDPRDAMSREAVILGMGLMNASETEKTRIYAAVGAGLANGTLRPIIGREFPLSDAASAHREILGSKALGKIVLVS